MKPAPKKIKEKIKVLVIDDEITSLTKLYLGLMQARLDVEVSDRIDELAQRLIRFKPQVLLLHYKMALQAEAAMDSSQKKYPAYVIYIINQEDSVDDALTIQKPFKVNEVADKIKKLFRKKKMKK